MLVLKRHENQNIFVYHAGERLTIKVCEARNHFAKIGFEGADSFAIVRDDVLKTMPPKHLRETQTSDEVADDQRSSS